MLLDGFGVANSLEGAQIHWSRFHFDIAEGSSGVRLIQILVPIALGLGHRSGLRGDRLALFACFGASLAMFLNLLRTIFLILSSDRRGASSFLGETGEAIALLILGGYGLWWASNRLRPRGWSDRESVDAEIAERSGVRAVRVEPVSVATAGALLAISLFVHSPFEVQPAKPVAVVFPQRAGGWTGVDHSRNYTFPYTTPRTSLVSRSFEPDRPAPGRPRGIVEALIANESRQGERIPQSKLPLPEADWHIMNEFGFRLDRLDEPLRLTEIARNDETEFALVYSWRKRDAGLFIESLRALSGIDRIRSDKDEPRVVVRIATPLASQLRSDRRRATRILDRFIADLRPELDAL